MTDDICAWGKENIIDWNVKCKILQVTLPPHEKMEKTFSQAIDIFIPIGFSHRFYMMSF